MKGRCSIAKPILFFADSRAYISSLIGVGVPLDIWRNALVAIWASRPASSAGVGPAGAGTAGGVGLASEEGGAGSAGAMEAGGVTTSARGGGASAGTGAGAWISGAGGFSWRIPGSDSPM